MNHSKNVIALESRLKHCSNVITLGVRPNFSDYSKEEASLIINAKRVYYPSTFYADMFDAMGKSIFPSVHTYRFVQDKIKQTALFKLLNVPHPATRIFYAKSKRDKILSCFSFPFIGKIPRGSALGRGVCLIHNPEELEQYCCLTKVAYVQEYLPIDRDIRVVIIGDRIAHAYWRINPPGEFRCNVGLGGEISFEQIPAKALSLALDTARRCGWNDVGIDICECKNRYYVLEANMKYGKAGFTKAGIDYNRMMEVMIRNGEI
ncbi:MAG: RimK family alpha-L-glutamate ligase [Desulfobacteraceae bacterium]|jgi:ribosomal protein S6--L-glutamate ligase|nr:RimK family alpha-L-glutamate ligase [Desulfobacteraceae bacterium]